MSVLKVRVKNCTLPYVTSMLIGNTVIVRALKTCGGYFLHFLSVRNIIFLIMCINTINQKKVNVFNA